MGISAVVLAKNEEINIRECLKTLLWCDEIIILDDNSTDKTAKLAEKSGCIVITHPLKNNFSDQRNFGMSKTHNEWVLFIDADERISEDLSTEIKKKLKEDNQKYNGYYMKRLDFLWGQTLRHGETGNIKLLRLAKKYNGQWEGKVHEIWNISGNTSIFHNPILHYPHKTVKEFIREIDYYSTIRARELFNEKSPVRFLDILLYPIAKFIINYFILFGFLDGIQGFLLAIIMSLHSFLVRSKLFLLWQIK